jgi:uncharacterized protein YkwD
MPARRSNRHRAVRGHQRSAFALGIIVAGSVVAAGGYLATTTAVRILRVSGAAGVTDAACPSGVSGCAHQAAPTPLLTTLAGTERATGPATPVMTASSAPAPTVSPGPTPSATTPAHASTSFAVEQVLKLINQARAQAGLPAYTLTSGLRRSSSRHNNVMAYGCGLSHQCPGEPSLGSRETAAGVPWTTAGENIGEGGPVANSSAMVAHMAVVLTQDMLNETPPGDGHRQNILSSQFHHIGIAVRRDSSGTVWVTQDFSN